MRTTSAAGARARATNWFFRIARGSMCVATVAVALLAAFATESGAQSRDIAGASTVSLGVAILPETVTVGEPFRLVVRLRAPAGTTLEFPHAPDSGTGVEALDPVLIVPSADTLYSEQTATYRLAAWDVGDRAIRLADILVREGPVVRRVAVGRDLSVFVASVLPADSTERVPKPLRPLYEFGPPWWWWALVGLAALGVLGLLWWLWRRRRAVAVASGRSAREQAEEEFDRIEALALVASGERGHHVALMTDVLRSYLARVLPAAAPSLTTAELLGRLRGEARAPVARLARLLQDVDLVKFAGAPIDAVRADAAGAEARAIVAAVDDAIEEARRHAEAQHARATASTEPPAREAA